MLRLSPASPMRRGPPRWLYPRRGPCQAVRLPKEYQFSTDEVFIRKEGDDVILSPKPRDWREYFASAPAASEGFMSEVEDLPVQERED
jgi:antitoxin VapB